MLPYENAISAEPGFEAMSIEQLNAVLRVREQRPAYDAEAGFRALIEEYDEAPYPLFEDDLAEEREAMCVRAKAAGVRRRRVRAAVVVAAVIVMFFGFSCTAYGAEVEYRALVWVKTVLHLPVGDRYLDFPALDEAQDVYGADHDSVPAVAPGYEITTMDVIVEPGRLTYFAEYECGRENYSITCQQYITGVIPNGAVQTAETVVTVDGTDYYFPDAPRTICSWAEGNCVYLLRGDLSEGQILMLLDYGE